MIRIFLVLSPVSQIIEVVENYFIVCSARALMHPRDNPRPLNSQRTPLMLPEKKTILASSPQ